eukprot:maker-scaffold158_size296719-snap-gene-1.20 protein:Tk05686 transcript:maker-scaffold158_size296719-snap-gene-1.20-mRNA-1 annotation:"conserved oligomeric golgi complex subunit 2"
MDRIKLVKLLSERRFHGSFWVDSMSKPYDLDPSRLSFTLGDNVALCRPLKASEFPMAKDFMRNRFFGSGNVAVALGLVQDGYSNPIVELEMEHFLKSGMGQIIENVQCKEVVSIMFNATWKVDPAYDSFPVSGQDWLNAAGEVAAKFGTSHEDTMTIWRDLQYQFIFHLAHHHALRSGKSTIFYIGMQFVDRKYKELNCARLLIHNTLKHLPPDAQAILMGTFPKMRGVFLDEFKSTLNEVDFVAFQDLEFSWNGSRIFENYTSQGGLYTTVSRSTT